MQVRYAGVSVAAAADWERPRVDSANGRLLRADQKAKVRSRLPPSPAKKRKTEHDRDGRDLLEDDMAFFWQCQSPGQTGDMKGCGFFTVLDMVAEGRGPCVGD